MTITPAVHSGAQELVADVLPAELAWLARHSMFRFGEAGDIEHDVTRLHAALTGRGPTMQVLRDRAWRLYEKDEVEALLALARETWARDHDRPSPALAEVCRTVAMSLARTGSPQRDLWSARALTTAFRAGAANGFAAALLRTSSARSRRVTAPRHG